MSLICALPLFILCLLTIFSRCNATATLSEATVLSSKCHVNSDGSGKKDVELVASDGIASPLKFHLTQTNTSPRIWNDTTRSIQTVQTGSYLLGNETLYSFKVTSSLGGRSTIDIHWGSAIEGAGIATLSLQDSIVSGDIDGRTFIPFKLGSEEIIFHDGQPPLVLHPKSNTTTLVQMINEQLPKAYPKCSPPPKDNKVSISRRQSLDWSQNIGHSTPFDDAACFGCKAAADTVAALGYAGCGFVCGSIIFSWKCGDCISAVTDKLNSDQDACNAKQDCCKNRCGGFGSGCCGLGEVCFPGYFNFCCNGGQQPCGAALCCNGDQSCVANSCCPKQQVCGPGGSLCCNRDQKCNSAGTACCPSCGSAGACCSGSTCLGGNTCCAQQDLCGSVCCPKNAGLFGTGHCRAPNVCCYNTQVNAGGICCEPGETNCGGRCCSGRCVNNSCVLTSQQCLQHRGNGEVCTNEGHWCVGSSFAVCQGGCCFPQPK